MELPPIDDARWDQLLRAVLAAEARTPERAGPLTTPFPTAAQAPTDAAARVTIVLDAYA